MNIEPNKAFTRFTTLLIELTQTLIFWTLDEPKHVHLFVNESESLESLTFEKNLTFTFEKFVNIMDFYEKIFSLSIYLDDSKWFLFFFFF